jgi:hypothetical protein
MSFFYITVLFLSTGKGTMNAARSWNLRQGYPISISYCGKVSVAPWWVQKQYNTFPPFKELSHDEGWADFAKKSPHLTL